VEATAVAGLTELLLNPSKLSVAAIGPSEERFLEAVEPICPSLVATAAA
jgi:hypothetical protein